MKTTKILYWNDVNEKGYDVHEAINFKASGRQIMADYNLSTKNMVNTFYNWFEPIKPKKESDTIFGFQARTILYNTFLKDYRE